jgi:hypothetical protein
VNGTLLSSVEISGTESPNPGGGWINQNKNGDYTQCAGIYAQYNSTEFGGFSAALNYYPIFTATDGLQMFGSGMNSDFNDYIYSDDSGYSVVSRATLDLPKYSQYYKLRYYDGKLYFGLTKKIYDTSDLSEIDSFPGVNSDIAFDLDDDGNIYYFPAQVIKYDLAGNEIWRARTGDVVAEYLPHFIETNNDVVLVGY